MVDFRYQISPFSLSFKESKNDVTRFGMFKFFKALNPFQITVASVVAYTSLCFKYIETTDLKFQNATLYDSCRVCFAQKQL